MDKEATQTLFEEFTVLSQKAFDQGIYESAYHALQSALHCAHLLKTTQNYEIIRRMAVKQSRWIDKHAPESRMSSQSAQQRRNGVNFYRTLIDHADAQIGFIQQTKS